MHYGTNNTVQAKDVAPFCNKGWPFFKHMEKLCPVGTIATSTYSLAPTEDVLVDKFEDLEDDTPKYEPPGGVDNFTFPADINIKSLLQLGHDLGFPNPSLQSSALDSAISMYNQVSPAALNSVRSLYNQGIPDSLALHPLSPTPHTCLTVTPSDQSHDSYDNQTPSNLFNSSHVFPRLPASSHTSLVASSGIQKAKSRGWTPAMSMKLSSLSSRAASKQSANATQARSNSNLSTSLAIHGMAGAILCVSDTFNCGLERITSPTTISPQVEQSTVMHSVAKDLLGSAKTRRVILTERPTSFWA